MPHSLATTTLAAHARRAALVVLAVASTACTDDDLPEFGSRIYEGADFEVWASDGLVACGGTHAYTESWLAAFRERVGEHGTPTHHRFFWLSPEDLEDSPCPDRARACAYWARPSKPIYSSVIPAEHEIVHVELAEAHSHPLLTEGAAELFGSIAEPSDTSIISIRELTDDKLPVVAYPSAGRFSRYLFDTHGIAAYFDLLNTAADADDEPSLDAAFRDALDITLDEAITEYETFSSCAPPMWRFHDYECNDLPLTAWTSADLWQDTIALNCEQPDVIGPRGDDPQIWTLRALEVPESGSFELTIASDEPATVELHPCFRDCFDAAGAFPPSPSATTLRPSGAVVLAPGRYWMRVDHPASSGADVNVTLARH